MTRFEVGLKWMMERASVWQPIDVLPDGRFAIRGVLPGQYAIEAQPEGGYKSPSPEYASVPVTVAGEDISGLALTTERGATIRGRIVVEPSETSSIKPGTTPAPQIMVTMADRLTGFPGRVPVVSRDGSFEIQGVNGPALIRMRPQAGWFLKAVTLAGKDVTDVPLNATRNQEIAGVEVVVSQRQANVTGTAVDERGKPVDDYFVVAFPEDPESWTPHSLRIATSRASRMGEFSVGGLPGGRYLVAAVEYLDEGEERIPQLLDRLTTQAARVTLVDGESKEVSLRLIER